MVFTTVSISAYRLFLSVVTSSMDRISCFDSAYISFSLLVFLLLCQDLFQSFLCDPLDLLPHSQKLYHLLCVYPSRDELGDRHLVFTFHYVCVNVVHEVHLPSLPDSLSISHLLFLVSFCKFRIDNCKGKIQQEESTNEHKGHEEKEHSRRVRILHHILNVTPAFHCHRLEHCQERIE